MFGFKLIKTRSKKKLFSDRIIYISIFMIVSYTIAAFILQFLRVMEISATLTTCWYGFWTAEIITLATIKNTKTKHGKEKNFEDYEENYSESEQ